MIHELLKTQRKPTFVPVVMGGTTYTPGTQLGQVEFLRRQKILRDVSTDSGYYQGAIVRPADKAIFDKEGYYRVLSIADNWYAYRGREKDDSKVEWPNNDNPKNVTIQCLKNKKVYECTANYVVGVTDPKELTDAQTLGG